MKFNGKQLFGTLVATIGISAFANAKENLDASEYINAAPEEQIEFLKQYARENGEKDTKGIGVTTYSISGFTIGDSYHPRGITFRDRFMNRNDDLYVTNGICGTTFVARDKGSNPDFVCLSFGECGPVLTPEEDEAVQEVGQAFYDVLGIDEVFPNQQETFEEELTTTIQTISNYQKAQRALIRESI